MRIVTVIAAGFLLTAGLAWGQSAEEIKEKAAKQFGKWDKDKDGSVTLEEFAGKKINDKKTAEFKKMDRDGNNSLSPDELTAYLRKEAQARRAEEKKNRNNNKMGNTGNQRNNRDPFGMPRNTGMGGGGGRRR